MAFTIDPTRLLFCESKSKREILQRDLEFYRDICGCSDSRLGKLIRKSVEILLETIRLYGCSYIYSSYNGGKDADVVMQLMRAAAAKYSYDHQKLQKSAFVYFEIAEEFAEVLDHIRDSSSFYHIDVRTMQDGIIKVVISLMRLSFLINYW